MIQAIQCRRPTFLGLPAWIDTPFSIFNPSPMQALFSEVAMLPSLLHQNDLLLGDLQSSDVSAILDMAGLFIDLSTRLKTWETALGPWPSCDMPKADEDVDFPRVWYPNITTANVYTHLWAFQITCRCEVEKLVAFLSHGELPQRAFLDVLGELPFIADNREQIALLARKICQSMDYLLQDEMGLFGPASTFFSLRMAYEGLNMTGSGQSQILDCIGEVVNRLSAKGLLAARALVFGTQALNLSERWFLPAVQGDKATRLQLARP